MRLSPAGLHLIASFEGFVPHPYDDQAGNATIGYGHLIHRGRTTPADRRAWGIITPDRGLDLLNADLAIAEQAVHHAIRVRLGVLPGRAQARYDSLVSLAFNIGAGAFAGSTLTRELNLRGAPRDWTPLGPHWLAWDHAGGKVSPGLLARRRTEFATFTTGRYPSP